MVQRSSVLCLVLFIFTAAAGAQAPAQRTAGAAPPVKTDATILQIMHAMVIPSTDAIFKAAGEPPTNADGWTALEKSAVIAAESGNLLMLGARAKDHGDWMKLSRSMVDAGSAVLKATMAKKASDLMTASDQLYDTCEACHTKYLPKP